MKKIPHNRPAKANRLNTVRSRSTFQRAAKQFVYYYYNHGELYIIAKPTFCIYNMK